MENNLNIDSLALSGGDGVSLLPTLFGFVLCIAMAFVLRAFYVQRSFSLTGKSHIAAILPILSAIVFIVIVVVKSSLALSLGLVGALSIVRFRTPIKEPEELVYLFMAIAIGLGYGAGHLVITTILVTLTLAIIYLWLSNRQVAGGNEYNLTVSWKDHDVGFDQIQEGIDEFAESLKLIRLDKGGNTNVAVMALTPKAEMDFDRLTGNIKALDPEAAVTFFEARTNW